LQIFLSYAAEDKNIAEPIAFSLRARGHKVFFDRDDLPPGGEYDMRIEQAVERSALFIFLLSPASVTKGRFTLTELDFARRKWRNADGHVLPVMAKPVPFEDIPNFLKSVTVLEPQGNIAAEVAAAVDPLAQQVVGSQMLVYGGLGLFSGLLTGPPFSQPGTGTPLIEMISLRSLFEAILAPAGLNFEVRNVSLAMELSGLAFAVALVAGFTYYFRFQFRQLAIIPFVLAGWFLAMQVASSFGMTAHGDLSENAHCLTNAASGDENVDPKLAEECVAYWRSRFEETEHVQQDLAA
jgi:hypothetical protein